MNTKLAYEMGRRVGLVKFAAALKPHKAKLVKLAKTLNALERKGKITKEAADKVFNKSAGILGGAGLLAAGMAAPHVWRGLKAGWKGLTGGGAKPGAATGGIAETGAAGGTPAAGEVTDKGISQEMQRYTGMNPAAMSQMNAARAGMVGRSAPYQAMAGTIRGAFGAM